MRKYFTLLMIIGFMAGCSSDDPSSPGGGDDTNSIAGVWLGTATLQSLSPASHPIAQTMAPAIGVPSNISIAVTQNGSDIDIRLTSTGTGIYTDYSGTMGASSFTAQWTYSSAAVVTEIQCADTVLRDMHLQTDNLTGTVSGNTITGTNSSAYNCVLSATQAPDGVVSGTAIFSITKSK